MMWEKQCRKVRIGYNDVPEGSSPFCIVEDWPPFTYRGPFSTRQEAVQRAKAIAREYGYEVEVEHVEGKVV